MKSFTFSTEPVHHKPKELDINGVKIPLATDLTGLDVMEGLAAAAAGYPRGIMTFLYKAVPDEQWQKFKDQTTGAAPTELAELATEIAQEFVEFPTSAEVPDSSAGASTTGNTSAPDSLPAEATPAS